MGTKNTLATASLVGASRPSAELPAQPGIRRAWGLGSHGESPFPSSIPFRPCGNELCVSWSMLLHTQLMKNEIKQTTTMKICLCHSQKTGTFVFFGNIPAEKLTLLPAAECSKTLMGEKKEKYKWFIKNLLFMKAKRGAGRNTGVRTAITPGEATVQPFLCPRQHWDAGTALEPKQPRGPLRLRWAHRSSTAAVMGPDPPPWHCGWDGAVGQPEHLSLPRNWNKTFHLLVLTNVQCPQTLALTCVNHWNNLL